MNLKDIKSEIRSAHKELRKNIPENEKREMDIKIADRVISLWTFREAETVLCYVSKDIEVGTKDIIVSAWNMGKRVAVPKCEDGTRNMDFYYISSFDELKKGSYGLMEPDSEKCERVSGGGNKVCIVPAITYDLYGFRLGFGKGYYDRFLSTFEGKTIGVCYSADIENELPHGKFDRTADIVVTEKKVYIIS
ncbi:MAG: 5-formyltetrahydrofolate cyclo-ligase [Clostridiales bacterium]|nr:5-formyltetrahydrofolate cyclo-ligase [Clostridiales bacterium]